MPKYMMQTSYTAEGLKGLAKEGGSARRQASEALIKSLGGRLESFYFAFGDADVVVILDLPDNAAASAVSMAVSQTGAAHVKTTVLVTPEEVDKSAKTPVNFRAPGR
jgi:uncharacterized protein with GYD domain